MAFGWQELLDIACFLEDGTSSYTKEAALRSATSRAYYAAFCHARNYARRTLNYQVGHNSQDHEGVKAHLRQRGRAAEADKLEDLRRWRNQCDYDDAVANVHLIAKTAIASAEEVLRTLV